MTRQPPWEEGDRVTVCKPVKVQTDWFLPGEQMWILQIDGSRVRVRCPSTGADRWVDMVVLEEWHPIP